MWKTLFPGELRCSCGWCCGGLEVVCQAKLAQAPLCPQRAVRKSAQWGQHCAVSLFPRRVTFQKALCSFLLRPLQLSRPMVRMTRRAQTGRGGEREREPQQRTSLCESTPRGVCECQREEEKMFSVLGKDPCVTTSFIPLYTQKHVFSERKCNTNNELFRFWVWLFTFRQKRQKLTWRLNLFNQQIP